MGIENAGFSDPNCLDPKCSHEFERDALKLLIREKDTDLARLMTAIGPYCTVEGSIRFATQTRQKWASYHETLEWIRKNHGKHEPDLCPICCAIDRVLVGDKPKQKRWEGRQESNECTCPTNQVNTRCPFHGGAGQ